MVLGAVQGVINVRPACAAVVLREMIEDRADLPNATRSTRRWSTGARLLGPVLAAELVALFGEGWCFADARELRRGDRVARDDARALAARHAARWTECGRR
jgi:hypothetical protein